MKALKIIVVFVVLAVLLRVFVLDTFIVKGDSMAPTIEDGDYVFVNRLVYIKNTPQRGDVIVANPRGENKDIRIIKRIIGLPGDRVTIKNGEVFIRKGRDDAGLALNEGYLMSSSTPTIGNSDINIDPYEYFVMGDNRNVSIDSREIGSIDSWQIKGKVILNFRWKYLKFIKLY